MEIPEEFATDHMVFAGSSERDVMCSKIFWSSLTLQPPLESRLVSGNMEQRLRPAGEPRLRKNHTQQQLEDLKTEYFLLEAQRGEAIEQRARYLQKAKRREEIMALLKRQREDRIQKELVSLGHRPVIAEEEPRISTPGVLEDIQAVKQLS
ncbi:cilia- and flagella-associated protein HOATZ isoform X2 [Rana temporaria]|uniref:cilia- and flagella-associated protein HOATZ isoform X2 n=1 Tax=Rana temporaria TaxID=8407 RepID=UPI001AAE0D57|nr:cilia- and flagella-associated protein HOATZ isoform X2 [Rana temporaria]